MSLISLSLGVAPYASFKEKILVLVLEKGQFAKSFVLYVANVCVFAVCYRFAMIASHLFFDL